MARTIQPDTTQEELNGTHWKCDVCEELKNWDEEDPSGDCEWFSDDAAICKECLVSEEIRRNTNVIDYKNSLTEKDKRDYTEMVATLAAFNKLLNKRKRHTDDETNVLTLLSDEVDDINTTIEHLLSQAIGRTRSRGRRKLK